MPTLHRPGVDIHYDVVGAGPAVLITHGYSATSHMWRDTARALAEDHRVVTWDIRGHGRSGSPADPALYSRDLAVADMAALLDAAGADDAVLMGHSLGGYLSLAFHVEHARRVRALVLVGDADTPFIGASEYMAKRLANATLAVIPGAGHMTNLDQPQAFQQALSGFLGSRLGKPPSAE